eukprot:jgi/Botrbrau1/19097/Bobra.0077s0011.1
MVRQSTPAAQRPEEHIGAVSDVSCPVLAKIGEAFAYAKSVAYRKGPDSLGDGSRVIDGKDGAHVDLLWIKATQTLVLAFRGPDLEKVPDYMSSLYQDRRKPPYLANVAPDAEVHAGFLDCLDSFLEATEGAMGMGDLVREVSGNTPPRRVLLTGWCMGGSLATVAAPWVALQCPTADVRCITFGAPLSGNHAFANVFKWLVGCSYRLVYAKDPMPEKGGGFFGGFVPVKGGLYLTENAEYCPNAPGGMQRDVRDHNLTRYAGALRTAIQKFQAAECKEKVCCADPDGCQLDVPKPNFEAWVQASGDSAVNMMKKYFYGPGRISRRHMWSSEAGETANENPTQEDMAAATEALRNPGPMPQVPAGEVPLEADAEGKAQHRRTPSEEKRHANAVAKADEMYERVVDEATAGLNTGLATQAGAPAFLVRAFSLADQEDLLMDFDLLTTLEKVLVVGKVSQAVVVAGAAYRDSDAFARITGISNTQMIDDKGKTDVQVHVGWLENGTAVFAFRGTESAQDGLQDAKFFRRGIDYMEKAYPGVKAHLGFLQQFSAVVNPDIEDLNIGAVLKKLSGGKIPTRVLCTGHSLGGALATLGATWAALEYPTADVRCITFGSPRVGNHKFRNAFHSLVATSIRVVYGADPVPLMPPSYSWWLRYYHVKGAMHVHRNSVVLRSRPWHYKWRPNVADHWVARYTAGLYTLVPGGHAMMPSFTDDIPTNGSRRRFDDDGAIDKAPTGCFGRVETSESSEDEEVVGSPPPKANGHGAVPARKKLSGFLNLKPLHSRKSGSPDTTEHGPGSPAAAGKGQPTSPHSLGGGLGRLSAAFSKGRTSRDHAANGTAQPAPAPSNVVSVGA